MKFVLLSYNMWRQTNFLIVIDNVKSSALYKSLCFIASNMLENQHRRMMVGIKVKIVQLNRSLRLTILSIPQFLCRLSIGFGVRAVIIEMETYLTNSQSINTYVKMVLWQIMKRKCFTMTNTPQLYQKWKIVIARTSIGCTRL